MTAAGCCFIRSRGRATLAVPHSSVVAFVGRIVIVMIPAVLDMPESPALVDPAALALLSLLCAGRVSTSTSWSPPQCSRSGNNLAILNELDEYIQDDASRAGGMTLTLL